MSHTLECRISNGDYAEAYIDADGDVRLEVRMGEYTSAHVYARPEDFAEFARKVTENRGAAPESAEQPASRFAIVDKARALLANTPHTAADIIRLAEFLAAE